MSRLGEDHSAAENPEQLSTEVVSDKTDSNIADPVDAVDNDAQNVPISLKRRQSEEPEQEPEQGAKRPRVDHIGQEEQETIAANGTAEDGKIVEGVHAKAAPALQKDTPVDAADDVADTKADDTLSPIQDAPRSVDQSNAANKRKRDDRIDERQRSKRLFGGLLGTLSQSGNKTAKRRQEIEARKKAEVRQQDEALREDRHRQREIQLERRRDRQWTVDEHNMLARSRQAKRQANFLTTTALPKLYYRPWTLTPEQEEQIREQRRQVGEDCDKEFEDFYARRNEYDEAKRISKETNGREDKMEIEGDEAGHQDERRGSTSLELIEKSAEREEPSHDLPEPIVQPHGETHDTLDGGGGDEISKEIAGTLTQQPTDDGNRSDNEQVVEGDEDTVLY